MDPHERKQILGEAAWVLERFPPELDAALPSRVASVDAVASR
jgi:hypothetical protein